jgi:hypothetical protein
LFRNLKTDEIQQGLAIFQGLRAAPPIILYLCCLFMLLSGVLFGWRRDRQPAVMNN